MGDDDINKLNLSKPEKDGLQVYRNYTKAFTKAREEKFAAEIDAAMPDITPLVEVLDLIETEHVKFVPVIACSFADEELGAMFRAYLPEGIPGGRSAMLGRFGPLLTLHNRIQFAFAFDLMGSDILAVLDKLRDQRNKISHTWKARLVDDFFEDINGLKTPGLEIATNITGPPETVLRIHTMWLLTRIFYEAHCYSHAKRARLEPLSALYGPQHPRFLGKVTLPAADKTKTMLRDGYIRPSSGAP